MAEIKIRILKDGNEMKYIPILRKGTNQTIADIRNNLSKNNFIISCNLKKFDKLQEMDKLVELLVEKGAKIEIYEDNRLVDINFLKNVIESHLETEKYIQELDDKLSDD